MSSIDDTLEVFTAKSDDRILRDGGSASWVLDPVRARQCTWLVCTQNRHNNEEYADGTEPHGSAFLLGRISAIRRPPGEDDRWLIAISEYARINIPNAWRHWRNPVRYTTLAELGIDLEGIEWQPVPEVTAADSETTRSEEPTALRAEPPLTIAEAKKRLAVTFGVKPEAIEITVRG